MDYKYELHHLRGNTYYIDAPTNLGLYKINEKDVILIDSGTHEDGKIIYKILQENNFNLRYIINTHSHADHSGGNALLLEKTSAKVIAPTIEMAFYRNTKLDIGHLFGGYPLDEFDNKLMHTDQNKEILPLNYIPNGLQSFKLPGHHYGMIGIKTADDVYFIADTLGSKDLVESQHILLVYDLEGYLNSLDYVSKLNGIIVPSHSEVTTDISKIVEINKNKIYEIINFLLEILKTPHTIEDITSIMFSHFNLRITYNKYLLITSTLRSYISYLSNNKKITKFFENNKLYFYNDN